MPQNTSNVEIFQMRTNEHYDSLFPTCNRVEIKSIVQYLKQLSIELPCDIYHPIFMA